jgi:hypothetical protein
MGRAVRFGDSSRNRLSAVEANQQQTSGIYVLPGMPEPPILVPRDKPKRARIGRRYAWAAGITAASLTAAAGGWAILTWPATRPRPVTLVTGLPARAAADIALPVARIEPPSAPAPEALMEWWATGKPAPKPKPAPSTRRSPPPRVQLDQAAAETARLNAMQLPRDRTPE